LLLALAPGSSEALAQPLAGAVATAPELLTYPAARRILLREVVTPGSLAPGDGLVAFRLAKPLRPGQRLVPFDGPAVPRIAAPTWFFWVDDEPFARFEHSTRYVLVDARTGRVRVVVRRWWPLIDGVAPWFDPDDYWNKKSWAFGNVAPPTPFPERRLAAGRDAAAGTAECAVIVDGAGDVKAGTTQDVNALGEVTRVVFGLDTRKLGPPTNTKGDIVAAVTQLVAGGCKNLLLHISSHGGKGYVQIGGGKLTTDDLRQLFRLHPDVGFKLVVDACHSGSFVEPLRDRVEVVVTSTDAETLAYGDYDPPEDPNPADTGGEFSSGLIEDLRAIPNDPAALADIQRCLASGTQLLVCKLRIAFRSAVAKDAAVKKGLTKPRLDEK
jgi:hypothetical protein